MAAPISYEEKLRLDQDVDLYNNRISAAQASVYKNQNKAAEIQADIAAIKADQAGPNPQTTPQTLANAEKALATTQARIDSNLETIKDAEASKSAAQAQLATFGEQTSVPSSSDVATEKKYEDPTRVPDPATAQPDTGGGAPTIEETKGNVLSAITGGSDDKKTSRLPPNIPKGADSNNKTPASAAWAGAKDLRVFLRVPSAYLQGPSTDKIGFPLLRDLGGIMFPYTPQISYESAASYTAVNPVHSNFTQQFYKNSSVGNISLSGKFTVQNEKEGAIYCAIIHLLRSLTKMRWGNESNAGSPPPVCRLDAFGDYMLSNVPVVITSVKFDLPDSVDYIQVPTYKTTLVPTISTISLGLAIMYSRQEMQDFTVNDWRSGALKGQGYL